MTFWSTDTIPERERFSFWREIICNTIFSISPEAPSERFSARVRVRSSGLLRFAMCQSTSYEIIRTQRDVNRAPADYYTVYLQLQGRTLINQCDEAQTYEARVAAGTIPTGQRHSDGSRAAGTRTSSFQPVTDQRHEEWSTDDQRQSKRIWTR